ncbi:Dam family site-specific DNA-(adenine-N6)-methyltransferase [Clostridium botulinum]|uniref:DNA adenine methylase n=1 Tax=Clostridium botulinum TaxID=1491 RepID=UPI0004B11981|nr:Dam family site-specific DNA-(adenine-N6)-methyltransferase [Clostridium botulinum]APH22230.1 DNA adenine methylase family protein [Clostridium botulinum]AUN08948.1 DNA adenine methylase [Clostridium botulinum]AUN23156.1 DNA adenine methylase [Clostridium botulinum]MBN3372164.1 DNA adenine methylase [Clostridium botulinum]MBN3375960.1 DNA adenine methylase [Clostridium botulinum]
MLKPPITRMGGKSILRKTIIEMIPKDHICYVEPFFGAGWVYFGKEPSKVEVINDIDKELVNLFKMIKYHAPEIERLLQYEFSGRDIFKEYKNYTIEYLTEIHRAVRFLYLISQSFASKGTTYGYKTTGKPAQQIFLNDYLLKLRERLKSTFVENLDFKTIIEKYDRSHTFFFCDPPYFETTGYGNEFGEKEHLILRDKLKKLKGKSLLTINDHPQVREWYKEFNIKQVEVNYSVSKDKKGRGKYKELIITNY